MKRTIAIAVALLVLSPAYAQQAPDLFVQSPASAPMNRSQVENAQSGVPKSMASDKSIVAIRPVALNAALLRSGARSISLNMNAKSRLQANMKQDYALDSNSRVWSGSIDLPGANPALDGELDTSSAFFVVSDSNRVTGQITIEGVTHEIITSNDGRQQFMVTRDFSKLPDADDTPSEVGLSPSEAQAAARGELSPQAVSTVRVLQIITPEAVAQLGGRAAARDRARFFLAQSNQVYGNNGLQLQVENAGIVFGNGNASQPTNDGPTLVDRLSNLRDGYLDTVAGAGRDNANADLVGLVVANPLSSAFGSLCGIADAIAANAASGFFVQNQTCTDLTFVHEMGHLYGARHDNDPTLTPFAYGHGFVNAGANLRTVMAVNSNPQPRVAFFSTDDQTSNGAALGNASRADNERVHEVRRATVAGFR